MYLFCSHSLTLGIEHQGGMIMRVAISTDGDLVSAHFGRCPTFTIVDIDNGNIVRKETLENPGHQPGFIPQFLHEKGVECIVCGGMGRRAMDLFEQNGIRTILGFSGKVEDAINGLLSDSLKTGESICQPGSGKGYGLDKSDKHSSGQQHEHHGGGCR